MGLSVSISLENDQREGGDTITFVRNQNGSVTITVEGYEDDQHVFVADATEARQIGEYFAPPAKKG